MLMSEMSVSYGCFFEMKILLDYRTGCGIFLFIPF